jgi:Cytochrome c554 and c-prime
MNRKKIVVLTILFGCVLFFSRCLNYYKDTRDPRGSLYAGSATCIKCHQPVYESYSTAGPASIHTIQGSFSKDSNSFIVNDSTKIVMEKRGSGQYQVMYVNGKEKEAHPFDIVFGNIKGQTYLYWKGDHLFQLPVSYFDSLHSWTSSPGYAVGRIDFNRPIVRRCFECHSSYIGASPLQSPGGPDINALDKNTLIYNIDCERCHGPAAAHVDFHTTNPDQKVAKYIVSYQSLSRTQKIDMCAVCHSGNKYVMLRSTFSFKPGDKLADYMFREPSDPGPVDVHGNQIQLLAKSKCFIMSNMDCATCHNTHVNDRGNYTLYARHCMTCHSEANHNFCKMATASNISFLENNCTKCHMPAQPSNSIVVQTSGTRNNMPTLVVNHHIAVYPDESRKIIAYLKNN